MNRATNVMYIVFLVLISCASLNQSQNNDLDNIINKELSRINTVVNTKIINLEFNQDNVLANFIKNDRKKY